MSMESFPVPFGRHFVRRIMPGFPELLDESKKMSDVPIGLLKGNWIRGAEIKLVYFDLGKQLIPE